MAKNSPFDQIHQRMGANFADFNGWKLPSDFGNPEAENIALQEQCAAFDMSHFGRIRIQQAEDDEFSDLLGISEQDLPDIEEWKWINTSINSKNLRLRIGRINSEFMIFTLPDEDKIVINHLETNSSGVQITDMKDKTALLALYGPTAVTSLSPILPFDLEMLSEKGLMRINFFMMNLTILRGSWLDGEGLELICPVAAAGFAAGAIEKYHKKQNITPGGMLCLQIALDKMDI